MTYPSQEIENLKSSANNSPHAFIQFY